MTRDPRVDAYIAKAAPFAQPILTHLRELIHRTLPGAEESIKWSMPAFVLDGGPLANMAAFKAHASFGFWRHAEVMGTPEREGAMGSLGRLTSVDDLPSDDELAALIAEAARLIRDKVSDPRRAVAKPKKPEAEVPSALAVALSANAAAQQVWGAFPPSHRREYCEWVAEAKREETRDKRVAQAIEWIAEGKDRNWKYKNC